MQRSGPKVLLVENEILRQRPQVSRRWRNGRCRGILVRSLRGDWIGLWSGLRDCLCGEANNQREQEQTGWQNSESEAEGWNQETFAMSAGAGLPKNEPSCFCVFQPRPRRLPKGKRIHFDEGFRTSKLAQTGPRRNAAGKYQYPLRSLGTFRNEKARS